MKKLSLILLFNLFCFGAQAKNFPAVWNANPDDCVEALQKGNIITIKDITYYVQYKSQIWLVGGEFVKSSPKYKPEFKIVYCHKTKF